MASLQNDTMTAREHAMEAVRMLDDPRTYLPQRATAHALTAIALHLTKEEK